MHQSQHTVAAQEKNRASASSFVSSEKKLKGIALHRHLPLFPGVAAEQNPAAQLKLRAKKTFTKGVTNDEEQEEELGAITDALVLYNQVDPSSDVNCQKRLGQLKALEESVYAWFSAHSTRDTDKIANALFLKTFLTEIKQEHEQLIQKVISIPNALPVDTSKLNKKEIKKVRKIWNDLLKNSGNLEIRDDGKGFRNRILAAFAKLLEGEFGRNMLADLNADRGGGEQKIIVGSDFSKELGDKEEAKSEAIPRSSLDPQRENDNDLLSTREDVSDRILPHYAGTGATFSPEEFHDFLVSHDDSELFSWGNMNYKKGEGTGSLVRLAPDNDYNIGEDEEQILMPEYITLGHELGHAQRILRGAPVNTFDLREMGVTGELDQKLWNNAEEYVNINAVENRLRGEHQISKRKYHAGDQMTLKFDKNRIDFSSRLSQLQNSLGPPVSLLFPLNILGEKLLDYNTIKPDFSNDKVMKKINGELEQMRKDTASAPLMWQKLHVYLRKGNEDTIRSFGRRIGNLLPYITDEMVGGLSTEVIDAMISYGIATRNWAHVGKIISWMRSKGNFAPMKPRMKEVQAKGGLIPLFEAGLTHEEFETKLDPNWELDVAIEYEKVRPGAWFFKTMRFIYVRRRMI